MDNRAENISAFPQPAFWACVAILATAVLGMSAIERTLGLYLTKEPLPPQQPLTQLDPNRLAPYRVTESFTLDDPELQRALGTSEYLQWVLLDPQRALDDPAREILLFLTYYPMADKVPHVPEECYIGSGFEQLATERVTFQIPVTNATQEVPGRALVFAPAANSLWMQTGRVPVLYLFRVNGQYVGSRQEARLALNKNLLGRASYFSKVELVFNRSPRPIELSDAHAAAQDLLATLLPLLEGDYWPSWPPQKG